MLVEHHAVETELIRVGELVDVLLVEPAALLPVPQPVRHRHPAGIVFFVEVRRQVRIGHEVPAVELNGTGHGFLTVGPLGLVGAGTAVRRSSARPTAAGTPPAAGQPLGLPGFTPGERIANAALDVLLEARAFTSRLPIARGSTRIGIRRWAFP